MLQRVIQSSVKWTHTQCMYVHRARGKLAKSMFVIHTHRQLIMIIHWSWSEYVLLTSPGSGLACFSQQFNATFPWFRAKHYGLWTPSGSADIKLVWKIFDLNLVLGFHAGFRAGEHIRFKSLGRGRGSNSKETVIASQIVMLLFTSGLTAATERWTAWTKSQLSLYLSNVFVAVRWM